MKTASKRHSFEDMKRFIYALAAAIVPDGEPAFYVNTTSSKNRFFFRVRSASNEFYYLSYNRWGDDIGTFGGIDSLFKQANPRIMFRGEQVVSVKDLVNEFNFDEKKLVAAIFKKINSTVKNALKCNFGESNTMHFAVLEDSFASAVLEDSSASKTKNSKQLVLVYDEKTDKNVLCSTPEISSIYELMVWADLQTGVN